MSDPTIYEQAQDIEPIPVHIASSHAKPVRPAAPEYGSCMTWQVDTMAVVGKPVQILTRRYRRSKAQILIPSLQQANGVAISAGPAAVTSPGASAVVSQAVTPAPGFYMVNWAVELSGTLAAADQDNFALTLGNTNLVKSLNNPVAGEYPQPVFGPLQIVSGSTQTIKVRTVAAGTVGSIYSGTLEMTPVQAGGGIIVLNSRQEALMQAVPVGIYVTQAPFFVPWENQKPCYATLLGTGPIAVSVLDQAYEEM